MAQGVDRSETGAAIDDAHIRTFLIADVRGYTVFTQEHGDEAAAKLARKFAVVAREGVEARGGTVVELRGDEALAVFDSARQAIRASVELQRRFVDETVAEPTLPLAVGMGLDAGEAVPVEGGYRGGALNLAARLCGIAAPAEILASPAVTHLARKVDGVAYVDRGAIHLKGLVGPVHVIRLRAEANDAADDMAFRRALGSSAVGLTPAVPGVIRPNPYKGLRAFEEGDAPDFFGREELVEDLVKRLRQIRFLAVVGPSGSGKSSVVRAGLIPALRRGSIPGSEGWHIADMFPGARPLDGLEAALLRVAPDPPPSLMDQLERDEHGLHRAILRLLPSDGSELVLVIDQFEEVFTLVGDEAVRTHFLGSLEAAATDPRSRIRVIATLRADFYDRPLLYRGFAELFKSRVEAVIPLSAEELERAISGPAQRVDVSLEPGLVAAMLADVAEEPGALPLMEYALTELFERRDGRVLFLEAYRQIGGVSGALGRRAEELYAELDDDGKEAARQLFLRLVALGEGTEDTRRRVPRAEVASLDVDQQAMTTVIDTFGASRQLSFDRDAATGAPTIELAHEAMLTAWPRLHRWIDAGREDIRTQRRLAASAREWFEADRDPSFLLQGSRLELAEAWVADSGLAATPEEREYLDASQRERERRQQQEEAREAHERELERRSFRRLRALVAVLAAAALVATGLTVFALRQSGRAETESRTAVARELSAASVASLESDPERSVLLALEAIDRTRSVDGTVLPEAWEALHRAVTASRIVRFEPGIGGAVDWSPNGVFVTEGPEDTGEIEIRDVETGEPVLPPFHGHDVDLNEAMFSPDGSMLASVGDDGFLKVWDAATGEPIASSQGGGRVLGVSFSSDGSVVAAAWPDIGVVRMLDPLANRAIRQFEVRDRFPSETALSPDGRSIAVAFAATNTVTVYDVASGEPRFELRGHRFSVNSIAWSPDGRRIATGGNESSARIWDGQTGRSQLELLGMEGPVISVDWSPDGERLLTGSSDGTARVWDVGGERGQELISLSSQGTRSGVWAVFSPDGDQVLTGDFDITAATIWDVSLAGDAEWANLPTDPLVPVDVAFLPGDEVAAGSDEGSVTVWDVGDDGSARAVRTLGPGSGSAEPVVRIAANHDGTRVATARGFSSIADVWDTRDGTRTFTITTVDRTENSDLTWSGDGQLLLFTDYEGGAAIYDATGDRVGALHLPDLFGLEAAAFSPDGRLIATADTSYESPERATVTIWDRETERVLHRIPNPGGASQLVFSPSGEELALAGFNGFVGVVEVDGGKRLLRFPANEGPVNDIAYSPDGSTIATAGDDGTVRLFNAEKGTQFLVLRGHRLHVSGIAFSPDGTRLASASADATVRVWALDLDDLIRIAHQQVTRELTDDECRQYLHEPNGCE
jgi:WD40 repeat protein/class 3 adenylate cyclase/energy-coupling factor transporter ATP-binding protein EcfA2